MFDMPPEDEGLEPDANPDNLQKKLGLGDFPSLRDLETSKFTKSNALEQKKRILQSYIQGNKTREAHLAILESSLSSSNKDEHEPEMPILFDKGYVTKKDSKLEVTSKLMSLMLFEKAGLVSIM